MQHKTTGWPLAHFIFPRPRSGIPLKALLFVVSNRIKPKFAVLATAYIPFPPSTFWNPSKSFFSHWIPAVSMPRELLATILVLAIFFERFLFVNVGFPLVLDRCLDLDLALRFFWNDT
jgi:hypothetical protein